MTRPTADRQLVEKWLADAIGGYVAAESLDWIDAARMAAAILDTEGVRVSPIWHPAGGRTFLVVWTPVEVGSPKPLPVEYRKRGTAAGEQP